MAPAPISLFSTKYAPAPNMADCKNWRKTFEMVPNTPPRSAATMLCSSPKRRATCQRSKAALVMPRACTTSASCLMPSDNCSPRRVKALAFCNGALVIAWFITVTTIKIAPPATDSHPNIGSKTKIAAKNIGAQGISNIAIRTGEAQSRCTDSRSRCAAKAAGSLGKRAMRFIAAAKTLRSSFCCIRAPIRAMIRPRAKSKRPIAKYITAISADKAQSVASDRLPSTRS